MKRLLDTENLVTSTIRIHLAQKQAELKELAQKRDHLREKEVADLELKKKEVSDRRQIASEEYEKLKQDVANDDENRARLALLEKEK